MVAGIHAQAAVNIINLNAVYTQDFNTLPSSGTNLTWVNNSTISGWHRNYTGTAEPIRDLSLQVANSNNTSGVVSEIGFINTGISDNTDRSVTLRANSLVTNVAVGAVFKNSSGQTAGGFSVSYTGEQWRRVSTSPASLYFEYAVVSSINEATLDIQADNLGWIRVAALEFVSPNLGSNSGLFGGKSPYQTILSPVTNNVTIANGQYLVIRWLVTDPVINPALGIDDVQISFAASSSNLKLIVILN
jgi:hypothetical protein